MDVEFEDLRLQKWAEDERKLVKKLGLAPARKLQERLAQLRAVEHVLELKPLPGNWHVLYGDLPERWAGDLVQPKRIIIRPTPPAARDAFGGVDWPVVRAVTVVEIEGYH